MSNILDKNCAPLMSDGRLFTDYRSRNRANVAMAEKNKLTSSNGQRLFLQNNGTTLMHLDNKLGETRTLCGAQKLIHPDPFMHDIYWAEYQKKIGLLL